MRGLRLITVKTGGQLLSVGTAKRPIRLVPGGHGDSVGLRADLRSAAPRGSPGSRSRVAATSPRTRTERSRRAAISSRAAQELLFVDHVDVKGSSNYGVSLRDGATFTADSHDLVITGSKKAPLRVLPRLVSNLPSGTYTGNTDDVVQVETEAYGEISLEDVTFHDRGIPYRVGGRGTLRRSSRSEPARRW